MSASLFLRYVLRWRSMALCTTLTLAPVNHLKNGFLESSNTFFQGLYHSSSAASFAQNSCGFLRAVLASLSQSFKRAASMTCFDGWYTSPVNFLGLAADFIAVFFDGTAFGLADFVFLVVALVSLLKVDLLCRRRKFPGPHLRAEDE